jgi:hypothetical protein
MEDSIQGLKRCGNSKKKSNLKTDCFLPFQKNDSSEKMKVNSISSQLLNQVKYQIK